MTKKCDIMDHKGGKSGATQRFNCTICGECCRGFNVIIDPWKEGGVVHLVKDNSVGVEVWPWEARELIMQSAAKDAGLIVMPSNLIMDTTRNLAVVLSYFIANEDCPLQVDKKCSIHAVKPNVCRYFPLVMGRPSIKISDRCPVSVKPKKTQSSKAMANSLKETYGNGFSALLMDVYSHDMVMDLVGTMELKGSVKWDLDPNPDHVLQKVRDQQWSDLLEFMIFIGFLTPEKVQALIADLVDPEGIEEKVDVRLLSL